MSRLFMLLIITLFLAFEVQAQNSSTQFGIIGGGVYLLAPDNVQRDPTRLVYPESQSITRNLDGLGFDITVMGGIVYKQILGKHASWATCATYSHFKSITPLTYSGDPIGDVTAILRHIEIGGGLEIFFTRWSSGFAARPYIEPEINYSIFISETSQNNGNYSESESWVFQTLGAGCSLGCQLILSDDIYFDVTLRTQVPNLLTIPTYTDDESNNQRLFVEPGQDEPLYVTSALQFGLVFNL